MRRAAGFVLLFDSVRFYFGPSKAFLALAISSSLALSTWGYARSRDAKPVHDRGRNHQSAEPLVVGRHHIPWAVLGGGVPDHVLVGVLVFIPVVAFGHVRARELPVFFGLLRSFQKASLLFLLRNMQEKLNDDDAIADEISFKRANVLEALLPNALGNQGRWNSLLCQKFRMYADHQRFLVIAPVENADVSAIRQGFHAAPEIIVIEVLGRRRLEGIDLAALGVDARQDVLDGAIFAGRVHGLKNQQYSPFVLRVKFVLQISKGFDADS